MSVPPRLHIAFVVESWATGVFSVITLLANSLPRDAFEITIIHGRRPETPQDFARAFTRPVTFIPWDVQREVSPVADLKSLVALVRILRRVNPDLVHAQSSKGGALGRIAAFLLHIPALYSPHGFGFLDGEGITRKAKVYRLLERLLGLLPAPVIASSQGELEAARSVARRVSLLPNMMDIDGLGDPPSPPSGSRLRVGAMGRIGPQKNFPAFAEVARLCGGRFEFIWIGGGDDVSADLRGTDIRVTGMVPRAQALAELSALDIVIQTSRFEGLSIALMEAMALSKPILATPVTGNADLVRENENGFLCARPQDFALRLHELADDPARRAALGARGRRLLEVEFSIAALLPRWIALYRQAAGQ